MGVHGDTPGNECPSSGVNGQLARYEEQVSGHYPLRIGTIAPGAFCEDTE